mmetsp:Transcript_18609/g.32585  ORF Transcript_18609/g.32585 Transcript_18609/m.32585 type:complete len:225 (+) Transcript_18609:431-1105(+)
MDYSPFIELDFFNHSIYLCLIEASYDGNVFAGVVVQLLERFDDLHPDRIHFIIFDHIPIVGGCYLSQCSFCDDLDLCGSFRDGDLIDMDSQNTWQGARKWSLEDTEPSGLQSQGAVSLHSILHIEWEGFLCKGSGDENLAGPKDVVAGDYILIDHCCLQRLLAIPNKEEGFLSLPSCIHLVVLHAGFPLLGPNLQSHKWIRWSSPTKPISVNHSDVLYFNGTHN